MIVMRGFFALCGLVFAQAAFATSAELPEPIGQTHSELGILALGLFVLAYVLVAIEEFIDLRKSKPVILAAGAIWIIVALLVRQQSPDAQEELERMVQHNLAEYAALFLFLLVAMTYINAMTERNVFEALRASLVSRSFNYRRLFWITGTIAFFLSPIADNMTTALLMGAVVLSVGKDSPRFVSVACVNIVVASNAGGAFSPFGDITTLMVWQSLHVTFFEFFQLFVPSVVNYLVPAAIMSFALPDAQPKHETLVVPLKRGAFVICFLFLCTIVTAVVFEQFLGLPPFLGMMTGMSYLFFYSHYVRMTSPTDHEDFAQFNIFNKVAQAEWDTLFFFFGVMFCVGGLGYIGYLEIMSNVLYGGMGATTANVSMGVISAIVDNIPVMFAVLTMDPEMSKYQWLLITLTTGVGGSLLSIGSAAGVALMGQARGVYTFFNHLKWSWAVGLGFAGSVYAHHLFNNIQ